MKNLNDNIVASLTKQFISYIEEKNLSSSSEISNLMRTLFDSIQENVLKNLGISQINSPNIVVEVIDDQTSLLFRRYLELEYSENSNGLIITGENINGEKAEIVFLSEDAISRISELKGDGENSSPCDKHS